MRILGRGLNSAEFSLVTIIIIVVAAVVVVVVVVGFVTARNAYVQSEVLLS